MKKPIYEEYILAHHLQHLSLEARDKLFVADLIQYQVIAPMKGIF